MTADLISEEYARRRDQYRQPDWGWSFLSTPFAGLNSAKVILAGLNPGGNQTDGVGSWDYNAGVNAYIDQDWELGHGKGKAPLQVQVRALLAATGVPLGNIACANFVPFRSPDWAALKGREEAVAWSAENLWRPIFSETPARLFLSLGRRAGEEIARVLGVQDSPIEYPVNWGSQRIREYRDPLGRVVLTIPHLSHFRLFSGKRSADVERVVAQAATRAFTTK